jgi:hypothetical protein
MFISHSVSDNVIIREDVVGSKEALDPFRKY